MYRISIKEKFESAHYLYRYFPDGSDEAIHGHTFYVEILMESPYLDNGISLDFIPYEDTLKKIAADLDHRMINEHPAFRNLNPTAENIAVYIYQELLKNSFLREKERIAEVKVYEGPDHYASFIPDLPNRSGKC